MRNEAALRRTRVCALIDRDSHVLLVRDADDPFYALPGGAIEDGEFSDQALLRECREELGVEAVSIGPLILVCENLFRWRGQRYQEIVLLFRASIPADQVTLREGEFELREPHLRFRWASPAQVATIDIRPSSVAEIVRSPDAGSAALRHRRLRDADF